MLLTRLCGPRVVVPRRAMMTLCAAAVFAAAAPAEAAPYPVPIRVTNEADIEQLYFDGEVDEDTRDRLLALFWAKVDLNLATRDEIYELPGFTYTLADAVIDYRAKHTRFRRREDLAGVAGMTPDIYEQSLPFVRVLSLTEREKRYSGEVRLGGIGRTHSDAPAAYLRARATFLDHGGVGFLLAVRPMTGSIGDASLGLTCGSSGNDCAYGASLSAATEAPRVDPAAIYAFWDGPRWSIIGGSYRLGYGLGVTVDNSGRKLPHGWRPNVDFNESVDSGSISPYDGFFGLALRHKQIELPGSGWLDVSVFGSWVDRDVYINDVFYNRGIRCDPKDAQCSEAMLGKPCVSTSACDASGVLECRDAGDNAPPTGNKDSAPYTCVRKPLPGALVNEDTVGDPAERHSLASDYPTLPRIMREFLGGANATYWINRRARVGLTGYAAHWSMTANADGLRPANGSRFPGARQTYGAVGLFSRFGFGPYDYGGEVAVNDRGGVGVLAKAWLRPLAELEVVPAFRYYAADYDNPYNRGDANGDEYLGNRARDELGGRLVVNYRPISMLRLRGDIDIWFRGFPSLRLPGSFTDDSRQEDFDEIRAAGLFGSSAVDLDLTFRAEVAPTSKERVTVVVDYTDSDVTRGGRGRSYYSQKPTGSDTAEQADLRSGGSRVSWSVRASTKRLPRLVVSALFKQTFVDERRLPDAFDHSWYAWLSVAATLAPGPRLALRVKYADEDTAVLARRLPRVTSLGNPTFSPSRCDAWVGLSFGNPDDPKDTRTDNPEQLPGICRGETYVDAYLEATQKFAIPSVGPAAVRLRVGWTHWRDHRAKWAQTGKLDPLPPRDEVSLKGYLSVKF